MQIVATLLDVVGVKVIRLNYLASLSPYGSEGSNVVNVKFAARIGRTSFGRRSQHLRRYVPDEARYPAVFRRAGGGDGVSGTSALAAGKTVGVRLDHLFPTNISDKTKNVLASWH